MCIFKCFRKKKKELINDTKIEVGKVNNDKINSSLDNDNLLKIETQQNNNFKNIQRDLDEEVDTSKDYEKVMARNAAVKLIQSDLDKKNSKNKILRKKFSNKKKGQDKKKNFEELFKKDK